MHMVLLKYMEPRNHGLTVQTVGQEMPFFLYFFSVQYLVTVTKLVYTRQVYPCEEGVMKTATIIGKHCISAAYSCPHVIYPG